MEALKQLEEVLSRPTCLAGIGNSLRADDGLGPYIIGLVRDAVPDGRVGLLSVEDVPENFAFPLSRLSVENVIFVDAVIADGPPGTVLFGPLEEFEEVGETASTHKLALRLSGRVIAGTGKKVYLLGVVPESTGFGKEMTEVVKRTSGELAAMMAGFLNAAVGAEGHERPASSAAGEKAR